MTQRQAQKIARRHIRRLGIPDRLDGVTVQIPQYDGEDTLRFLKTQDPGITLASQALINRAFSQEARKRGAEIQNVPVAIKEYFAWLEKFGLKDNPGMRAQYISWVTCPEPRPQPKQV